MIFDFIAIFVREVTTLSVSKAEAFLILPVPLAGWADQHLRSFCSGARSDGFKCQPKAVNQFFELCQPWCPSALQLITYEILIEDLKSIEITDNTNIIDATYLCGNVYNEIDKMILFVKQLFSSTETVVARFQ